ncbi:MAG: ABC transporter ATP-binding protein [Bacteroidia bacterium]|nr:ABC transporter ATP-binding protein [Bacteroidia bacterium]
MDILNVHNFSVSFKIDKYTTFQAVKKISFSIQAGEVLGLIGESGSGKSVASQSVTRLLNDALVEGNVFFSHKETQINLTDCSRELLQEIRQREIAYIFQEPMTALNPLIQCGKQILECAEDPSSEFLAELLEKVELFDIARINKSYPHELSGGQRQRVMIAMALAKKPKLLIADEPTTALDVAVQTEILQLLRKLCKETSLSILFITHDLISLKGFADRIAVMYNGELVEVGESNQILNQPLHPYTKALIQSRATYDKKGTRLAEIDNLLEKVDGELHFKEPVIENVVDLSPEDNTILEAKDVYKSHFKSSLFKKHETKVLHAINFELKEGDSLGLIGESGSGKSTIAKIVLKIWDQTNGDILLNNNSLNSVKDLSKQIQLVFQDPFSSLNPKHKIGHAIVEVLRSVNTTKPKERAISLLEEVGLLAADYEKYPHEFSGGQRQRICIAKALAKKPKIIVLDEAVSALDVSVQAKILNLLNDLKKQNGLTYLLISHDMNVVSYFCNKAIVLKDGKIVEFGETKQLITKPSSNYTRSLLEHSIN